MSRRRFYASPESIDGSIASLSPQETHHLIHVLRLTPGDEAFVFDGCGREYRCSFRRVENDRAMLEIVDALFEVVESPLDLTLAQALVKGEKFDLIIQKATELGVRRIAALSTRYSDMRLDDRQKANRVERWRRVSLEAVKQCGRRTLVEISEPLSIRQFIRSIDESVEPSYARRASLLFNERGGVDVTSALVKAGTPTSVLALVGPEGGWSDDELEALNDWVCTAVSLGPRVLRTETAAIAAITLIQYCLGDLLTHRPL